MKVLFSPNLSEFIESWKAGPVRIVATPDNKKTDDASTSPASNKNNLSSCEDLRPNK